MYTYSKFSNYNEDILNTQFKSVFTKLITPSMFGNNYSVIDKLNISPLDGVTI